ncbi:hypothetical protein BH09PAT2_BH09PAT2_07120 [soil metagenome]
MSNRERAEIDSLMELLEDQDPANKIHKTDIFLAIAALGFILVSQTHAFQNVTQHTSPSPPTREIVSNMPTYFAKARNTPIELLSDEEAPQIEIDASHIDTFTINAGVAATESKRLQQFGCTVEQISNNDTPIMSRNGIEEKNIYTKTDVVCE